MKSLKACREIDLVADGIESTLANEDETAAAWVRRLRRAVATIRENCVEIRRSKDSGKLP